MKSTIADIRQLFYTNSIVAEKDIEDLAEGELGIFPEDSNTSIAASVVYATLPEKFRIVSRANGKLLFSMDTISKDAIRNIVFQEEKAEVVNVWETVVEGSHCDCIEGVFLNINIDSADLLSQDGLTWTHRDTMFEIAPEELRAICECGGEITEGVNIYQNHLMTAKLLEVVLNADSPYYTAEVKDGDNTVYTDVESLLTYIENNKDNNLGDDSDLFTDKLTFVLKGKVQPGEYDDLDVNYVHPRGVRLTPAMRVSGIPVAFTETQALVMEIGAGADLRLQEWENMNFYTDLNFYPQISCGIKHKNVKYQFENGKRYDALSFEFDTKKVERNTGETKMFGATIASDNAGAVTRLKEIFGIA